MLIPLTTDRPSHRRTVVTPVLIAINVLIFVVMAGIEKIDPDAHYALLQKLWLAPDALTWWGFITSCFIHGGVLHIGFNMVFLWVFGPSVEDRFGRGWFAAFYLVGGLAAGGLHVLFDHTPVIGASGAIAAVTGAFLIMFPLTKVSCIWLLSGGRSWVSAWWFIGFAIVIDTVMTSLRAGDGVAHLAHLGGYGFGAVVSFTLLATGLLSRESYDVFAMLRQAQRRRAIKDAVIEQQREIAKRLAPGTESETEKAVTAARAEVIRLAQARKWEEAAQAYTAMLDRFPAPDVPRAHTTMNRAVQLEIGNLLFATARNLHAAGAYERFAFAYKDDPEAPRVLLMLALVCVRRLNNGARAREALDKINGRLSNEDERILENALTAELKELTASGTNVTSEPAKTAAR